MTQASPLRNYKR